MNASGFEQELAAAKGVTICHWLQPKRVIAESGKVSGIELEYTAMVGDRLAGTGETVTLSADQVFKAIVGASSLARRSTAAVSRSRWRTRLRRR